MESGIGNNEKLVFTVDRSKQIKRESGRGEDAPPKAYDGVMVVCDGTGASGMDTHRIGDEQYTSAYLGSRKVAEIAVGYLLQNGERLLEPFARGVSPREQIAAFRAAIRAGLDLYVKENGLSLSIRGKSIKLLPTTLAAALYRRRGDRLEVLALSAGDSRILFWAPDDGLQQLSVDDVDASCDAFSDVSNVGNCISADGDFHINYVYHNDLPLSGVLFATTDGFTDPVKPFEQEAYLLSWLGTCPDLAMLGKHIGDEIDRLGFSQKDDCSISGVLLGELLNTDRLRELAAARIDRLKREYIEPYHEIVKDCDRATAAYQSLVPKGKNTSDAIAEKIRNAWKTALQTYGESGRLDPALRQLLDAQPYISDLKEDLEAQEAQAQTEMTKAYLRLVKAICGLYGDNEIVRTLYPADAREACRAAFLTEKAVGNAAADFNAHLFTVKDWEYLPEDPSIELDMERLFEHLDAMKRVFGICCSAFDADRNASRSVAEFFLKRTENGPSRFEQDAAEDHATLRRACVGLLQAGGLAQTQAKEHVQAKETLTSRMNELEDRLNELRELQRSGPEQYVRRSIETAEMHMDELVRATFTERSPFELLTGMNKTEFDALFGEANERYRQAQTLIAQKNALWQSYRAAYERFRTGSYGRVPADEVSGCEKN